MKKYKIEYFTRKQSCRGTSLHIGVQEVETDNIEEYVDNFEHEVKGFEQIG
jgi:hypothetical protein|tara:strand:+ start:603 stop:755 length:153 start_codon:yes stop_codon:yes gene_type:complete